MNLVSLFENIEDDWVELLDCKELYAVLDVLQPDIEKNMLTPNISMLFNFARYTSLSNARVVIIGQDPYPTAGEAHGLSFSSLKSIPKSLKYVYDALIKSGYMAFPPEIGDLTNWAEQGVVMLNRSLSLRGTTAKSHSKYWMPYTELLINKLIDYMKKRGRKLIFILWGTDAKSLASTTNQHNNCITLIYGHPSPRGMGADFANCPNFTDCNRHLTEMKAKPINWNVHKGYSHLTFDQEIDADDNTIIAFISVLKETSVCYTCFISQGPLNSVCIQGKTSNAQDSTKNIAVSACLKYISENRDKAKTTIKKIVFMSDDVFVVEPRLEEQFIELGIEPRVAYYGTKKTIYTDKKNFNIYCETNHSYVTNTTAFNMENMENDTVQYE